MSSKNNREQQLLLFLSKKQEYVTADSLARVLDLSQKTIYRLIKKINETYQEGPLIVSEKGKGYRLDYEKYINYQRRSRNTLDNFSPNERRKHVMEQLLLSSPTPINIRQLFEKYFVGDSVIFRDEQIMSEELKKYDLILERKNRTLTILGKEVNIRKAIKDSIEILNIIDLDDLKHNQELNFNKYDVLFVLDQIRGIEKKLDITIPYPYNINIFSHLYILLNRARKGSSQLANDEISQEELRRMEENEILYSVAKSSVNNIEKYLNIILPDIESYFIYQYLVSSRMQGNFTRSTTFSIEVIQVTKLYIEEMSSRLGIEIENETIFVDLANHIKPMLNRLEHKIRIKNSLLGQIKATYEQIFAYVQEVSYLVSQTFDLPIIKDDENGFITLYFAKFIELSQNQQPIKTLIMCTTGIGTSELLRAKVAKKFPELEIIDVIASRNAKNFKDKYADIELILSTIAISEEIAIDYLLVSAMFTMDDQKRVQGKIEEIYYGH